MPNDTLMRPSQSPSNGQPNIGEDGLPAKWETTYRSLGFGICGICLLVTAIPISFLVAVEDATLWLFFAPVLALVILPLLLWGREHTLHTRDVDTHA